MYRHGTPARHQDQSVVLCEVMIYYPVVILVKVPELLTVSSAAT